MWNPLKKKRSECKEFRESLEDMASGEGLSEEFRGHAKACKDCDTAFSELVTSRELLSVLPRQMDEIRPWFAPRVMAAIAARETELRRSLDAWVVVPRLAARLTWISALALVLASTWFLGQRASTPLKPVTTDLTGEPVHESLLPLSNDDVLLSLAEKGS